MNTGEDFYESSSNSDESSYGSTSDSSSGGYSKNYNHRNLSSIPNQSNFSTKDAQSGNPLTSTTNGGFFNRNGVSEGSVNGGMDWWQNIGGPASHSTNKIKRVESVSSQPSSQELKDTSFLSTQLPALSDSDSYEEPSEFPSATLNPFQISDLKITRSYNGPQFVRYDKAAPLLWTVGYLIITFLDLGALFMIYSNIENFKVNPYAGVDFATVLAGGAKYGPLIEKGEWWRFLTSIITHAGVIQYIIHLLIIISMKDFEKHNGFWHSLITFLIGGVYGFILSAMFAPDFICCGAAGAIMCWCGIRMTELYFTWREKRKWLRLICLVFSIIVLVLIALFFPFSDNFMNVGGLVMGILIALMMLPNVKMQSWQAIIRGIIALLAFPVMATLFCMCLVLYYRNVQLTCSWCVNAACIKTHYSQWCATPVYN